MPSAIDSDEYVPSSGSSDSEDGSPQVNRNFSNRFKSVNNDARSAEDLPDPQTDPASDIFDPTLKNPQKPSSKQNKQCWLTYEIISVLDAH